MTIFEFIDSQLLLLANSCHSDWADQFMMMFTGRFIWVPMYVALAFIVARYFKPRKAIVVLIGVGVAIAMADQTCATLIRPIVARLRPSNPDNPLSAFVTVVNGYRGGSYGFPSCHAANSFALVAFMSLLVPRRRLIFFMIGWAVVNSYSRLYLGVHYPGDLLAGALVGAACGTLAAMATRLIIGMPLPHPANGEVLQSHPRHLPITPSALRIAPVAGLTMSVSDIAPAVGFATIFIIAAIAL
ncbi:MAG: phosphatase PAP2 family protein [Pseudoflavonifractor sp.]|nr:phosphatase PAP2 family protein [Alloprevotella sp.]MCM1116459.1 phosphatase PAP2 family protein [Pseudoflavonifractor sp.]